MPNQGQFAGELFVTFVALQVFWLGPALFGRPARRLFGLWLGVVRAVVRVKHLGQWVAHEIAFIAFQLRSRFHGARNVFAQSDERARRF